MKTAQDKDDGKHPGSLADDQGMAWLLESVRSNISDMAISPTEKKLAEKLIKAMQAVDRRWFVADKQAAYLDIALPTAKGQTISQPSTVARMLLLLQPDKGQEILEAGTGSGWNAALLSFLTYPGTTLSVDVHPELIDLAKKNVFRLLKNMEKDDAKRLQHLRLRTGDLFRFRKASEGFPDGFDRIIITAGIKPEAEDRIKALANDLLKDKGILLCPYASGPILIFRKKAGKLERSYTKEHYAFVPLLG